MDLSKYTLISSIPFQKINEVAGPILALLVCCCSKIFLELEIDGHILCINSKAETYYHLQNKLTCKKISMRSTSNYV